MTLLNSAHTALRRFAGWIRAANRRRLARRRYRREHVQQATPGPLSAGVHRIEIARSASALSADIDFQLGHSHRLTAEELCAQLGAGELRRGIVVCVSHDDYELSVGGVQIIISEECAEFARHGVCYLHLCPVHPIRSLSPATLPADFDFAVRLRGQALGRIDGLALQEALASQVRQGVALSWTLHHLMGHSPEVIAQLIGVGTQEPPLFWAHDFYSVCTGYTLLRNDVLFCNAPAEASAACRVCVYGQERRPHAERIRQLLSALQPMVIAPSQSALDLWSRAMRWPGLRMQVRAPARLVLKQQPRPARDGALRIAFLGGQAYHKGWEAFGQLALAFKDDARFAFYQFSESPHGLPTHSLRHVPVKVSRTQRDAMTRALALHEIDVVLCLSLAPETFNFTVHEAIAAGAFVVVRRDHGNVWQAAKTHAPLASHVVEDEADLEQYLRTGTIIADVAQSPRYLGALLPSAGSADLLALARQAQPLEPPRAEAAALQP